MCTVPGKKLDWACHLQGFNLTNCLVENLHVTSNIHTDFNKKLSLDELKNFHFENVSNFISFGSFLDLGVS